MNGVSVVGVWTKILSKTHGRFFSISFYKKDGTLRRLNGKIGNDFVIDRTNHVIVWDAQKKGFRKVNLETVQDYKCGQVEI